MIFNEFRSAANSAGETPLSREQVWHGLEQKARNAVPFVEDITECRVINTISDDTFDREVLIGGRRYVERVWLQAPSQVVFTRLEGPVLGTITNEIVDKDGEFELVFQFALSVPPAQRDTVSEQEVAERMAVSYKNAVDTTLAAVRAGDA